jgi:hypothetical protein
MLYWDAIDFVHLRNDLPFCRRHPLREGAGVLKRNVQNLSPLSISMGPWRSWRDIFSPAKYAKIAKYRALALFALLAGYLFSPAKVAKIAKYRALALLALLAGYFFSRKYRRDCYTGMQ